MRLQAQEEEPALEDSDEYKSILPPLVAGPGLKIRIPPELMPDEQTILHYFDLYFANVHPYVPVLDKVQFYQQWQNNRDSISPLLLEAIFAIAGRLADDPAQGQQWLALATSAPLPPSPDALPQLLTSCRTRRFFHGCSETQHPTSPPDSPESERIRAEARLLLPFMDERRPMRRDGQGYGVR